MWEATFASSSTKSHSNRDGGNKDGEIRAGFCDIITRLLFCVGGGHIFGAPNVSEHFLQCYKICLLKFRMFA